MCHNIFMGAISISLSLQAVRSKLLNHFQLYQKFVPFPHIIRDGGFHCRHDS